MILALESFLVCPICHGALESRPGALRCKDGGTLFEIREGIVHVMRPTDQASFSCFDAMVRDLERLSHDAGFWHAFYGQQVVDVEVILRQVRAQVILDIGCGPTLPYAPPRYSTVVGLDASYDSLRHNRAVDIRVWGVASHIPLPAASVDAIVCFYSLHHLIEQTARETRYLVEHAFAEFERVLRPGGALLVVEVAPWWPVWYAQRLLWTRMRRWLGQSFNAFFWRRSELEAVAADAGLILIDAWTSRVPPFLTFPVASASWSPRLPRVLYPFSLIVYHWRRS